MSESYTRFQYKKELEVISNLKDNPSVFYKFARKKALVQSNVGPLKDAKGQMINENLGMAETLANQYYSIGQDPFVSIDNEDFIASLGDLSTGLHEFAVDPEKVKEILKELPTKSGPGPDGIPPHCLKYGGETVISAMCDIAGDMFRSGDIPDGLKDTWITPVWKGTNKEEPSDYRPIAITSHVMKVIERMVRTQVVDFLTMNGTLDNEQHGGRAFRSTLSQLLTQNEWIID